MYHRCSSILGDVQVEFYGLGTPGTRNESIYPKRCPFGLLSNFALFCVRHRLNEYWQSPRPRWWTGPGRSWLHFVIITVFESSRPRSICEDMQPSGIPACRPRDALPILFLPGKQRGAAIHARHQFVGALNRVGPMCSYRSRY